MNRVVQRAEARIVEADERSMSRARGAAPDTHGWLTRSEDENASKVDVELPVTSEHAVGVNAPPRLHRDPFDRPLVSQAMIEGVTLLTSDDQVAQYPGAGAEGVRADTTLTSPPAAR